LDILPLPTMRSSASGGSASLEVIWRAGPYAVVWKGENMPLNDSEDSVQPAKPAESKGKRGRAPVSPTAALAQTSNENRSLVSLANDYLGGMGKWEAASSIDDSSAGLVLLLRSGIAPPESLEGIISFLVAPLSLDAETFDESQAEALWSDLGLLGDLDDEGPELVSEGPSGHFGRLALIERSFALGVNRNPLVLATSLSDQMRKFMIDLQDIGFGVVRLPPTAGRGQRHVPELATLMAPVDALPTGLCLSLTAIKMPDAVKGHPVLPSKGKLGSDLFVRSPVHKKLSALMESERLLVSQRLRAFESEEVTFRGLSLTVPAQQLRPRVSSGSLVDAALRFLEETFIEELAFKERHVLDLGVGSGALLLSILKECPQRLVGCGVDIDAEAIQTTQTNAERVLGDKAANVSTVLGDFCQLDQPNLRAKIHERGYCVIICNPPYRSVEQQAAYDRSTGRFGGNAEHARTLVAGETGLEMYEGIAECLVRDINQSDPSTGRFPILPKEGLLIFQVEAGAHGTTGGMAMVVAGAVEKASGGKIVYKGIHTDEQGLERAVLMHRVS